MIVNGAIAERKAWLFLRKKKYKLLESNYRTRFGEVDLIVENNKYIVFAEVKMRTTDFAGEPREAVTFSKQQKIIAAAKQYLSSHNTAKQPRFDVIEVICDKNSIKSIKHLENAFELV